MSLFRPGRCQAKADSTDCDEPAWLTRIFPELPAQVTDVDFDCPFIGFADVRVLVVAVPPHDSHQLPFAPDSAGTRQ